MDANVKYSTMADPHSITYCAVYSFVGVDKKNWIFCYSLLLRFIYNRFITRVTFYSIRHKCIINYAEADIVTSCLRRGVLCVCTSARLVVAS